MNTPRSASPIVEAEAVATRVLEAEQAARAQVAQCEDVRDGVRCEKEAGHDTPDEFGGVDMHHAGDWAWGELELGDDA